MDRKDICILCGELNNNKNLIEARDCEHRFHPACLAEQHQRDFICPVCPNQIIVHLQGKGSDTNLQDTLNEIKELVLELRKAIRQMIHDKQQPITIKQEQPVVSIDNYEPPYLDERTQAIDKLKTTYYDVSNQLDKQIIELWQQFHQAAQLLTKDKVAFNTEAEAIKEKLLQLKHEQSSLDYRFANQFIKLGRICSVPSCLEG